MTLVGGYVYVIALSSGTVKVGRSQDVVTRLGTHRTNARSLGLTVIDTWTSPPHAEWYQNEDALKKIAADLGGIPEGRETFSGVEFAAVVDRARRLAFTEAEPAPEVKARPVPPRPKPLLKPPPGSQVRLHPYPSPYSPSVWAPADGSRRRGTLTPRERAIALAALEVGLSDELAETYSRSMFRPPVAAGLLDAGLGVDDLEAYSPDEWVPGLDRIIRDMKAMIRLECDIESLIAKNAMPTTVTQKVSLVPELSRVYGSVRTKRSTGA